MSHLFIGFAAVDKLLLGSENHWSMIKFSGFSWLTEPVTVKKSMNSDEKVNEEPYQAEQEVGRAEGFSRRLLLYPTATSLKSSHIGQKNRLSHCRYQSESATQTTETN